MTDSLLPECHSEHNGQKVLVFVLNGRGGQHNFLPLPLRERAGVRGGHARSRPSVSYPRGVMPVLPGQMRSEILPFEAQGRHFVQNDNGGVQNGGGRSE